MLTLNADDHPLMRRMHKPEPKLGPDQQDKQGRRVPAWAPDAKSSSLPVQLPVARFCLCPLRYIRRASAVHESTAARIGATSGKLSLQPSILGFRI